MMAAELRIVGSFRGDHPDRDDGHVFLGFAILRREAVDDHRRDSTVRESLSKPRSRALIDGAIRSGARAMLRACGLQDDDFKKPLIVVANSCIVLGPCNYHVRYLAQTVK